MRADHAPRIYNLYPLLAGPANRWAEHLPRIAGMGFDTVLLGPFHAPGASGSVRDVRDHDRLHPALAGDTAADGRWEGPLSAFCAAAAEHRLRVLVDLVLHQVAADAPIVERHPGWFARPAAGTTGGDVTDPRHGDSAQQVARLRYGDPAALDGQLEFWGGLLSRYLDCGVSGFRCEAAHRVPPGVWGRLIERTRRAAPGVLFMAWSPGATRAQQEGLAPAGFDLMGNSARWWDFRSAWLFEEDAALARIAPTVAFPESHDTPRLMTEFGAAGELAEARYRMAYGFASTLSSGVLIPMGFEYGFAQPLDPQATRAGQWDAEYERRPFDLTGFIGEMNRLKASLPALGRGRPPRRISAPDAAWVAIERRATDTEPVLVVFNPRLHRGTAFDPSRLVAATGRADFQEATVDRAHEAFVPGEPVPLPPCSLRIFRAVPRPARRHRAPNRAAALRRLEALAAQRIAIEKVSPEIDGGRFPVKRVIGDVVEIAADVFGDGHEAIRAVLRHRPVGARDWQEIPMSHAGNDRWSARLPLTHVGDVEYTLIAWRDRFRTWRDEVTKKVAAEQDVTLECQEGMALLGEAQEAAAGKDKRALASRLAKLERSGDTATRLSALMDADLLALMDRAAPRSNLSEYGKRLGIVVDRPAARFAAWYEMFPRSQAGEPGRHGTFRDVIDRLPYVRDLGFDVLYFTPIHPIGKSHRKGRNNTLVPGPDDPGSVYAIGSEDGGHSAVHPELGTLEDFRALVEAAREFELEIALDLAVQCSPDHPWLSEHPEWFDWRPDGTIKYAENPPKKYQDIVNVHFYRDAVPSLWFELKETFEFWIGHGVKAFRVDNPHTKPFPFWEWVIGEIRAVHPDVIFLSEAFTRPKVMLRLAKLGFTQSYTYFTWRNGKQEMAEYLTELTTTEAKEVFRPNFFVNTPDINPAVLQDNNPAAYAMRLVLAATLSGAYGVYNGFEICEGTPLPGKEEYLDSEKYEIKDWDFDRPGNIKPLIRRVNAIRRENPALWTHLGVQFLHAWNDQVLYYLKMTPERDNAVLVMVNMDPNQAQEALFEVPLWEFGLPDDATIGVEDLLDGHQFTWHGKLQRIRLDPAGSQVKIWRLLPPDAT